MDLTETHAIDVVNRNNSIDYSYNVANSWGKVTRASLAPWEQVLVSRPFSYALAIFVHLGSIVAAAFLIHSNGFEGGAQAAVWLPAAGCVLLGFYAFAIDLEKGFATSCFLKAFGQPEGSQTMQRLRFELAENLKKADLPRDEKRYLTREARELAQTESIALMLLDRQLASTGAKYTLEEVLQGDRQGVVDSLIGIEQGTVRQDLESARSCWMEVARMIVQTRQERSFA